MRDPVHPTIYLKDYSPPDFLISNVDLEFDIQAEFTRVRSRLALRRNPAAAQPTAALILDGEELELESISLDGVPLERDRYTVDAAHLSLGHVPERFTLEVSNIVYPHRNTQLMGLFTSSNGLFTQCEAQGFRRITYFIDRPDVMARYTTTIHADESIYPVLLSNGNPVGRGQAAGRHWARWEDPFPKPSYLFAMVACRLDRASDSFTTRSGRNVSLEIYVEPGRLDQADFAMQALKKSMQWDEQAFGLEMDLDIFMIAAVGDFNMGAMENKGLNIFNTKYILARPDTATDSDYQNVDRVIAHEYFHNWTGNRVTCRDWFQLSLKEGLTVFRDQEYGADMYSRAVQRIQEVRGLRAGQFPEDAGPMAHPVRPTSYMEISNFYTATVYEKGAEVVRMIHTLIGAERFRRGMDLYFERHDGQAVTTDDFVQAMQDASDVDLTQFRRWYDQAGTPVLNVRDAYDASTERYTLTIEQSCAPTPGEPKKLPFHIPFELGLLAADGSEFPLQLAHEDSAVGATRLMSLHAPVETFSFVNVPSKPIPSLLRGFTAPVTLKYPYSDEALTHLMAYDSDSFNRWEAGQRLVTDIVLASVCDSQAGRPSETPAALTAFIEAFKRVLGRAEQGGPRDPAFAAEALTLPSDAYIAEQMEVVDPDALFEVRLDLRRSVARALAGELHDTYRALAGSAAYSPDAVSAGRRALRNLCLAYLIELDNAEVRSLALEQFDAADNMTDRMAALSGLANIDCPERSIALERFYAAWREEPLVVDKWLAVQATSRLPGTLVEVRTLLTHPAFDIKNPNKVYALIRAFCGGNHVRFHAKDGAGYAFGADQIVALDAINAQVAARIARCFDRWRKFDLMRQAHARAALERVHAAPGLSKDVMEIVTRALA